MSPSITTWCRRFNRPLRTLAAAALIVSTLASSSLVNPPAAAAAGNSVYWGAYISGGQDNTSLLDAYEAKTGTKMSIVHWGEAWMRGGTFGDFQTQYYQTVRNRGAIPMVTWGSWQLGSGTNQPNFRLAEIANGRYDAFITKWAQSAKTWGQPFFLRFDHEMNGNWQFPWSEQLNGNQPGDYVRAWQHVHDIFVQQQATNATWVWCPNTSGGTTTPLAQSYPGDSYVDWTCIDGYNWGTGNGDAWQTIAQVLGGSTYGGYNHHDTYQEMLSLAPSKPIMLGEVSSSETGGSKAAWITDMLKTQLPITFPRIKAMVWTEENFSAMNWMMTSSASSQAAFASGISTGYYAGNAFGALTGGAIQPLGDGGPPPAPTTVSLNPVADTYTARSAPTSTTGGSTLTLRADLTGTDTTFMRFDLSSLAGKTITSATLRLHTSTEAWAGSLATFDARMVGSTGWSEASLSYTNSVAISSVVVGSLVAPSKSNTWYDITLSPTALQAQTGNGLALALSGRTGDVLIVNSREAGQAAAPQLIVNFK